MLERAFPGFFGDILLNSLQKEVLYCLVQIVLFLSLSIEVQIISNTKELLDRIRNLKWNTSPNVQEDEKNARQARFFVK